MPSMWRSSLLHVVTTRIESYSQHTADQLQDASHDAWALHHYCISPDFHYWLRHVLPSDAVGYAERVDEAALSIVGAIAQDPHPELWRDVVLRRLIESACPSACMVEACGSCVHLSPAAY